MFRKLFLTFHRIAGVVAALFLAMWFISGLVLVYHSFPNVTQEEKYMRMEMFSENDSLPDISALRSLLPDTVKIGRAYINKFDDRVVANIHHGKTHLRLDAITGKPVGEIDENQLNNLATRWSSGTITRIDTLQQREMWIMYNRYLKELPIYKIYFDDADKHQLYVSSRTGEVQQFTGRSGRLWAWLGAIPHKLYIPMLRDNSSLWADTITVIAVICLVASVTGIYLGVSVLVKNYRRNRKLGSPYKKKWYHWHYVSGLVFGLFVVSWSISGTMSVKKIPQWIVKSHRTVPERIAGRGIGTASYRLTPQVILNHFDSVKQIEWRRFQKRPVIEVVSGSRTVCLDASVDYIKELNLSSEEIKSAVAKNHKGENIDAEIITEADNYYVAWKKELPLPVCRVTVDDADHSTYYVNPSTGDFRYVSDNRRAKRWLFHILHYFNHQWFANKPVLWTMLIWTTALGCAVVSVSGVWLSWRYVGRKFKRRCNRE